LVYFEEHISRWNGDFLHFRTQEVSKFTIEFQNLKIMFLQKRQKFSKLATGSTLQLNHQATGVR